MNKELKQVDKNKLQDFVGKSFDKELLIGEDILELISTISVKNNIEIAVVTDRKGNIIDITTGDSTSASVSLDDTRGLRVLHTHPFASSKLSQKDLNILRNQDLDYIIAISVDDRGFGSCDIAYYDESKLIEETYDNAKYINKYGIQDKISEVIAKKRKLKDSVSCNNEVDKAVLVFVDFGKSKFDRENSKEELYGLCATDGIEVVGHIEQNRGVPDVKYYIGAGKVEELKDLINTTNANLVIFESELSSSKQCNLTDALNVKVIDRSMLILDIFAKRARTNEGKLQVELAQLKYMLPRLKSYASTSNRYGGGVGMRGPGETKLEMNRRVIENNIVKKSKELEKLKQHRDLNRKSRTKNYKPTVSIVGYTNSGKSSLLNVLAKENIYAKDELFATLDTTSRNVWLGSGLSVVFTDTVGFISNLPHEFIEAFGSTLEECIYSDLLLIVIDISNPKYREQEKVTFDVLDRLGSKVPVIKVYNKADKVDINLYGSDLDDGIVISNYTGYGIDKLKNEIVKFFQNK